MTNMNIDERPDTQEVQLDGRSSPVSGAEILAHDLLLNPIVVPKCRTEDLIASESLV